MDSYWRRFFSICFSFTRKQDRERHNLQRCPLTEVFTSSSAPMGVVWGEGALLLCADGNCVCSLPPNHPGWVPSCFSPLTYAPPARQMDPLGPPLPLTFSALLFLHREQVLYFPTGLTKHLKIWFFFPFILFSIIHALWRKGFLWTFVHHTVWTGSWWFLKKNFSDSFYS